jgi:hypothetical protein
MSKTVTTTIRITEEEAERLRKVAARQDRSMASVIPPRGPRLLLEARSVIAFTVPVSGW